MRRLLVIVVSLVVGLQACTRSADAPLAVAGQEVVAGTGTGVFPPPSASQVGQAVGFDGTSYLVVWTDSRAATGSDVYAARLSAAGALLDAAPIVVSAAPGEQVLPDVSFDGENYLVVWQDHRSSGDKNIHAARVTPGGAVLDAGSIAILLPGGQQNPEVAFDGLNHVVVWEDQGGSTGDIRGARISPTGAVLDAGFVVSAALGHQVQPAIGCPATARGSAVTCLAAWRDGRNGGPDVYGALIAGGAVLGTDSLALSLAKSSQGVPAVAGDGTQFLVAWNDTRTGTSDVYGARVALDGQVLDQGGLAISVTPGAQTASAVTFEGAYFLVLWEDGRSGTGYDVYGARVGAGATVLDPGGFLVESGTSGARVALASDGAGRALVASDRSELVDPLLGTRASRLSARILISRAKLTVAKIGSGTGTVASQPAGIDCGELCSTFFDAPTDVNLTPTAAPGSAFVAWSGSCSGSGACTVTVDDTREVTAKFSLVYPLTITRSGTPGTVVSSPAGIDCGAVCAHDFVEDTLVELTPIAGTNSLFKTWSAPCDLRIELYDPLWLYNAPRCRVPMRQAWAVTATFGAAYRLTVNATGTAAGRVDASSYWPIHCTTASSEGCSSMVPASTPVKLVATPGTDAILKSWSGCPVVNGLECDVTVTTTKSVTATFQPARYLLTAVASGSGRGTISGPGISCGAGTAGDCTEMVANGALLTLEPLPDADSIFKSWTGCTSVTGTTCNITMSSAKTATATFQPSTYPLTLNSMGGGGGVVSSEAPGLTCTLVNGVPCSGIFANGETVVLTASPDASSVLKSWTGCTSVAGPVCTVVMSSAKNVTVKVEPSTYLLTAAAAGAGSGSITGTGISCGAGTANDCTEAVANGAVVTFEALPDASSIFKSWSGCTSISGTTCSVTMTAAKNVTATFQPSTYPLSLNSTGGGGGTVTSPTGFTCTLVNGMPCNGTFANGETVVLTATPDASSVFKSWTGCTSVAGAVCTVTMSSAKSLTVKIEASTYLLTAVPAGTGAGSITGPGISCGAGTVNDCTEAVTNGAVVTLEALPDAGSIFKSWSGCTSVSGTTCSVTMASAKTASATFQPSTYSLSLNSMGGGGGVVSSETPGFTCTLVNGVPCNGTFANGETVVLTASPDASSVFKSWTGCTSVDGPVCTVTMTAAKNLTVKVEPSTYLLSAAVAGTGAGSITGPGISCGAGTVNDCTEALANGALVTLEALPDANSIFKSWTGCTSVSGTTCSVTMASAKTPTATFLPSTYLLTAATGGSGSGTITGPGISCGAGTANDCTEAVENGGSVTLEALPGADSILTSWSGCSTVSGTTCTVSMTMARTATATFQPSTYVLTAMTSGAGSGTITGPGISCGAGTANDCSETVANGESVTLEAVPDASSIFRYWTGCSAVSGTTCTVSMTMARTATAQFQPSTYLLSVTISGMGSVAGGPILCSAASPEGCSAAIANGESVTLTATAAEGALFRGWTGCSTVSGETCTVNMTAARSVIANF